MLTKTKERVRFTLQTYEGLVSVRLASFVDPDRRCAKMQYID